MIANRDEIEVAERKAGSPSERDLQIYAAVRVDGRRQADVAAELGITQGRVSQIVRRVQRWRAGLGLEAELERRDRQSVDRWLEQLRIEKLYEETMELFRQSCQPRRKERRGKDRRGEWSSETIDHGPGNLQCLKLAGRLLALRRELDVEPPPPDQSLTSPRSHLDEYEAFRLLVDMRNDAMQRGDVPKGEFSEYVVRRMIGELVGRHDAAPEKAAEYDFEAREAADVAGQDSSCQATERQEKSCPTNTTADPPAPERQDKSCPTNTTGEPNPPTANTAAIITDISAAGVSEASGQMEPTTCAAASCDEARMSGQPSVGANNRQILQVITKPNMLPACVLVPVESSGEDFSSRLRRTTAG